MVSRANSQASVYSKSTNTATISSPVTSRDTSPISSTMSQTSTTTGNTNIGTTTASDAGKGKQQQQQAANASSANGNKGASSSSATNAKTSGKRSSAAGANDAPASPAHSVASSTATGATTNSSSGSNIEVVASKQQKQPATSKSSSTNSSSQLAQKRRRQSSSSSSGSGASSAPRSSLAASTSRAARSTKRRSRASRASSSRSSSSLSNSSSSRDSEGPGRTNGRSVSSAPSTRAPSLASLNEGKSRPRVSRRRGEQQLKDRSVHLHPSGAPKRPPNSYGLFLYKLREMNANKKKMSFKEFSQYARQKWSKMSAATKKRYQDRAEMLRREFDRAKQSYQRKKINRLRDDLGPDVVSPSPKGRRTRRVDRRRRSAKTNPFMLFTREFRDEIKKKNPKATVPQIAKEIGKRWRALNAKDKEVYIKRAREAAGKADERMSQRARKGKD